MMTQPRLFARARAAAWLMQFCFAFVIAVNAAGAPTITQQPANAYVLSGQPGILSTTATGTGTITYQWYRDGWPVSGATSATLGLAAVSAANGGLYHCVITDDAGASRTNTVRVEVVGNVVQWSTRAWTTTTTTGGSISIGSSSTYYAPNVAALADGPPVWAVREDGMLSYGAMVRSFFSGPPSAADWVISGFSNVVQVATLSSGYCLVLSADGVVRPYGLIYVPAGLPPVARVSATVSEGIALHHDGTISQWPLYTASPVAVSAGPAGGVVGISSGWDHHLALKSDGTVSAWGDNGTGECDVPAGLSDVKAVSAGMNLSVALKSDGTVVAWGDALGGATAVPAGLSNVVEVKASYTSAGVLATRQDGSTISWGTVNAAPLPSEGTILSPAANGDSSARGIRPHAPPVIYTQPQSKSVIEGESVDFKVESAGNTLSTVQWFKDGVAIPGATSSIFTLSIAHPSDNGSYTAQVTNAQGTTTSAAGVLQVTASAYFTLQPGQTLNCAAVGYGTLHYQWYRDGRLVPGATSPAHAATVPGLYQVRVTDDLGTIRSVLSPQGYGADIVAWKDGQARLIARGNPPQQLRRVSQGDPGLAITGEGKLVGVSVDSIGYYGQNFTPNTTTTTQAPLIITPGVTTSNVSSSGGVWDAVAVALRSNRAVVLHRDGHVSTGQYGPAIGGINLGGPSTTPAVGMAGLPYPTLSNIIDVSASDSHFLALSEAGVVTQWDAVTGTVQAVPALVTDVRKIASGTDHHLALLENGTVVAWGNNSQGECDVPAGLTGIDSIVAGPNFSLALRQDGIVIAWGTNANGETSVPLTLDQVVSISATHRAAMAVRVDGSVVTWGSASAAPPTLGVQNVRSMAVINPGRSTSTWAYVGYGLYPVPQITQQPQAAGAISGEGFSLSVTATSAPAMTYQWRKNGADIAGATSATYSVSSADATHAGEYSVVVSNSSGSVTSASATVSLLPVPDVVQQPVGISLAEGGSGELTVTATSATPMTYQWLRDGAVVAGATSATLRFDPARTHHAGVYRVIVSNPSGSRSSLSARVGIQGTVVSWKNNYEGGIARSDWYYATTYPALDGLSRGEPRYALTSTGSLVGIDHTIGSSGSPPSVATTLRGAGTVVMAAARTNFLLCLRPSGQVEQYSTSGVRYLTSQLPGKIVDVSVGEYEGLALTSAGNVTRWNLSPFQMLTNPASVANVAAIASGKYHHLALRFDGTVVAWGYNFSGECDVPAGLSGVVGIAAGQSISLALKQDGTVVGWGASGSGVLSIPAGLSGVKSIRAGDNTAYAILSDGGCVAWGDIPGSTSVSTLAGTFQDVVEAGSHAFTGYALRAFRAPQISQQPPTSIVRSPGQNLSVPLAWKANPAATIQWFKDGTPFNLPFEINHQISYGNPLTIQNTRVDDSGTYFARITNSLGTVDSQPVSVIISSGPVITTQPAPILSHDGSGGVLSVAVTANGSASYQWYRGGAAISGADQASFSISAVNESTEGVYHARVTDLAGTTVSRLVRVGRAGVLQAWMGAEGVTNVNPISRGIIAEPASSTIVSALSEGSAKLAIQADGRLASISPATLQTFTGSPPSVFSYYPNYLSVPPGLVGDTFVAVSARDYSSTGPSALALRPDGTIAGWSGAYPFSIHPGAQPAVAVSLGTDALSLKPDGSVVRWSGSTLYPVPTAAQSGVKAISAGYQHYLALKTDGTVVAWGDDSHGESTVPSGLANVKAISAGYEFSLALHTDGTVTAWGRNTENQCTPPAGLSNVVRISAGEGEATAVKADGTVVVWGTSRITTTPADLPQVLDAVPAYAMQGDFGIALVRTQAPQFTAHASSVSCGQNHIIELTAAASGTPEPSLQWQKDGADLPGATSASLRILVSSATDLGSYRLVATNAAGSTNSNAAVVSFDSSGPVFDLQPAPANAMRGETVTLSSHASGTSGTVSYQWYKNGFPIPAASAATLTFNSVTAADVGDYQVRANDSSGTRRSRTARIRLRGSLAAWGCGIGYGPESTGDTTQVAVGHYSIITLEASGTVRTGGTYQVPYAPVGAQNAVAVAANWLRAASLRADGAVVEWASDATTPPPNQVYQIGYTPPPSYNPVPALTHPTGAAIARVALGKRHTLALLEDGTLTSWAAPGFTQAQANDSGQMSPPAGLTNISAIAAGDSHSLALLENGSVVAWGSSAYGQSDVPAAAGSGVIAIDARRDYSMALKADGSVLLWGRIAPAPFSSSPSTGGSTGSTGGSVFFIGPIYYPPVFADTSGYLGPWARSGSLGAISISAGEGHALATLADGNVISWGNNSQGQATVRTGVSHTSWIAAGGDRSAALVPIGPPLISRHPVPKRIFPGYTGILFSVEAGGSNNYQWQKNGVDIPGAYGPVLAWGLAGAADVGDYRCVITNSHGTTISNAVPLEVGTPQLFTDWRTQNFTTTQINAGLAAPHISPDSNGIPNLIRYALGLNTSAPEHHRLPQAGLMNDANGTCYGSLTFDAPQDLADVIFRLRVSSNLQTWTTYSVAPILGPVVNGRRQVTLCDPNPTNGQPRFYRLEVMQTAPGAAPAF